MATMRYVRLKSDPLKILHAGYVSSFISTGYNQTLYEEVSGDLPAGWQYIGYQDKNTVLDAAFQAFLPQHLGQPYLTDAVIAEVFKAKVAVIEATKIDPSGQLSGAIIRELNLPTEMENDRQALIALL